MLQKIQLYSLMLTDFGGHSRRALPLLVDHTQVREAVITKHFDELDTDALDQCCQPFDPQRHLRTACVFLPPLAR